MTTPYGAVPRGPQTGTPNTKPIGASGQKFGKTLNPWGGPNIPKGQVPKGTNSASGSSTSKPVPDPQLFDTGVRSSDPLEWPVVLNWDGSYTRQPSTSGITANVINKVNAAVEHAYTRDGYQASP